jgi:hypothetical protein
LEAALRLVEAPGAAGWMEGARGRLEALTGAGLPVSAVHGDFWRGNVAERDGAVRVFDWEWARMSGRPLFDVWAYELADLLERAQAGDDPGQLREAADDSAERVRAELAARGIAEDFAGAAALPALAVLGFRMRELTGHPGPAEPAAGRLFGALAAASGG